PIERKRQAAGDLERAARYSGPQTAQRNRRDGPARRALAGQMHAVADDVDHAVVRRAARPAERGARGLRGADVAERPGGAEQLGERDAVPVAVTAGQP